ncbi:hypothetical protein A0H81_06645 [Grifola frondosa]|uniref:Uncharacterized protein n=1 Tax=Grifola frondosa TaxID=5627 RepID=A0A1C7M974_GRIFR|nr:hypothetical protein A0H81_06645 [Grifola frondosa]
MLSTIRGRIQSLACCMSFPFRRTTMTSIAYLLLRCETIYFASFVLIYILSVISNTIGSIPLILCIWAYFEQVLTPIFLCRHILNLREEDDDRCGNDESRGIPDLHFASGTVGDLGASLDFDRDAGDHVSIPLRRLKLDHRQGRKASSLR